VIRARTAGMRTLGMMSRSVLRNGRPAHRPTTANADRICAKVPRPAGQGKKKSSFEPELSSLDQADTAPRVGKRPNGQTRTAGDVLPGPPGRTSLPIVCSDRNSGLMLPSPAAQPTSAGRAGRRGSTAAAEAVHADSRAASASSVAAVAAPRPDSAAAAAEDPRIGSGAVVAAVPRCAGGSCQSGRTARRDRRPQKYCPGPLPAAAVRPRPRAEA
jgi:hypothetical protein